MYYKIIFEKLGRVVSTMRLDVVEMIQIFLILSFVLSIVSYVVNIYGKSINRERSRIIKENFIPVFLYFKNLDIEDYVGFEKYGIWRFSGRF